MYLADPLRIDRKNVINDEDIAQIVNEYIGLLDNRIVDLCHILNSIESVIIIIIFIIFRPGL